MPLKRKSNRFLFYIAVSISALFLVSQFIQKTVRSSTAAEHNTLVEISETAAATPKLYQPLKDLRIVLDPGHGGSDPGAIWGATYEKDITLQIAEKLKQSLEKLGSTVFTTRDSDMYINLKDRVYTAKAKEADLFISIHLNFLEEDTTVSGIETYCTESTNKNSTLLAEAVHSNLIRETDAKDRNVRIDSNLYVVRRNTVPSCLIETGFLTSETEGPLLLSDDYQDKLVAGICNGIIEYHS